MIFIQVAQERICDDELIMVRSPKQRTAASIILRGPNGKLFFLNLHYLFEFMFPIYPNLLDARIL